MRIRSTAAAVALGAAVAVGAYAAPAAAAIAPLTVTVDPAGTANADGSATVSGTVTCPVGNTWYGTVKVWQPVRTRYTAAGQGNFAGPFTPVPCTGTPQPWSVTTTSRSGVFLPGPGDVRAVFSTQGPAGLNTVATDSLVVLA